MKYLIILFLVTMNVFSQEYIQTYSTYANQGETPTIPSNSIGAILVDVENRDPARNTLYFSYTEQLSKITGKQYPLLSVPLGSIISLKDGMWGADLTEIEQKRQTELLQKVGQDMALIMPLLTEHPSPENVPLEGLMYRLQEDGVIKLFFVRQTDLLSTQLSAHDKDGNEITRTVNLKTGEDVTINLRKLSRAKNFNDLNSSESIKTNQTIKGKNKK